MANSEERVGRAAVDPGARPGEAPPYRRLVRRRRHFAITVLLGRIPRARPWEMRLALWVNHPER